MNPKTPLHMNKHVERKTAVEETKRAKRSPKPPSHVEEDQAEVTRRFSMWSLPTMVVVGATVILAAALTWIYQKKQAGSKDLSEA